MTGGTSRISDRFASCASRNRTALVSFLTAGDPDPGASREMLLQLPGAGVDVLEIGMPFSDPQADGPLIQQSSQRALRGGQTLIRTLELVSSVRESDARTPIILMGYYNPIFRYGNEQFLADAREAGVDGIIVVDLPPEFDSELCLPARELGLSFIRLVTPTTHTARLQSLSRNASGFVYYVSVKGITGVAMPDVDAIRPAVEAARNVCRLPVAVGFGIRKPEQAAAIGRFADGVVVGSHFVSAIGEQVSEGGPGNYQSAVKSVVARACAMREGLDLDRFQPA